MKISFLKIIVVAGIVLAVAGCSVESTASYKYAHYVNNSEMTVNNKFSPYISEMAIFLY